MSAFSCTRVRSCNTSANYKLRARAFKSSSVLTFCDDFSMTLLTNNGMSFLAILCNKDLENFSKATIALALRARTIFVILKKFTRAY